MPGLSICAHNAGMAVRPGSATAIGLHCVTLAAKLVLFLHLLLTTPYREAWVSGYRTVIEGASCPCRACREVRATLRQQQRNGAGRNRLSVRPPAPLPQANRVSVLVAGLEAVMVAIILGAQFHASEATQVR